MKKNFIIAAILGCIALICALAIAGMNMVTSSIIEANNQKTELETCQAIFADYDKEKSIVQFDKQNNIKLEDVTSDKITKKVDAYDASGNLLGYLYTVTGKNSYGAITLMVAIKDDKVVQVEFLENGQSFASTVVSHVQSSYPSSPDETIHAGFKPDGVEAVGALTGEEIDSIDTVCGATYGAVLVKDLVKIALNDAKGVN